MRRVVPIGSVVDVSYDLAGERCRAFFRDATAIRWGEGEDEVTVTTEDGRLHRFPHGARILLMAPS